MKRLLLLPLAAALLAIAPASAATTKTVQVTRSGFSPATTTITVGDSVSFHNSDTQDHQVVADDGSFASPVLKAGQDYSVTFSTAKRIRYHDGLHPTHHATVVVSAPPATLSLAAASQTVVYGSGTTLTGQLSTKQSGQSVALLATPATAKTAQQANVVSSDTTGAYSFQVAPTIQTVYQAQWHSTTSPAVTVQVAPRVGFGLSGRIYTAKVTSDITYGGHYVYLQRFNSFRGTWVNWKRFSLSSTYSRAKFTLRLPKGRNVMRIWLPQSQAGVGYVQSLSRTLVVVRR
jgi:plastocyanin